MNPVHLILTAMLIGALLLAPASGKANDISFTASQSAGLLKIEAITASEYQVSSGEQAVYAIDNDLRTKWAAPGMSQWLTVDLGIPQQVSMTRISFSAYQWGRSVDYTIATSLDGFDWTIAAANTQSQPYLQWSETAFTPLVARYVRITINSATLPGSVYAGDSEINEVQIYGNHVPPVRLQVPAITASDYDITKSAVAENVLDGDLRTSWSASGLPQWITLDLGTIQLVNMARISFTAYQWGRNYAFTVATSLDGTTWTDAVVTDSIPYLQWTEVDFTPINARYVRVTLNASSLATANAEINEIEIFGFNATVPPATTLTLSWSPDLSGITRGYIVYYGATPETADLEISNIAIDSAGFDPSAPSQQYDPYGELGLLPGDNVCFRLKAYNDMGVSPWSSAVCGGV